MLVRTYVCMYVVMFCQNNEKKKLLNKLIFEKWYLEQRYSTSALSMKNIFI